MIAVSIMIEGQQGLTWPRWQRLAAEVDGLGFAGLFRSDHFTDPRPPDRDALEMVVSLAYLAAETKNIHFGPMVAPVSFRDPIQMARHAIALDQWSGGRMILGLGAGWQEREHTMFGYDLGDVKTRMDRLEEAMEVVYRLLRGSEPVSFKGQYYNLHEAHLMPRSDKGPRLLIGGNGPKRTLPLTARYADIWNGVGLTPDRFRELNQVLDDQLREIGRSPGEVRRTVMAVLVFGKDDAVLEAKLASMRGMLPPDAPGSTQEQLKMWRDRRAVVGTPDAVLDQLRAYEVAGVEEIMFQWLDMDDIEGLRALASTVLPAL